ncbi:hypothetical protein MTP06_20900 [Streptomyces sp. PLM4]|nr:hypothetical protein MTP06_20900 [Streptomyces sp. PLM4]
MAGQRVDDALGLDGLLPAGARLDGVALHGGGPSCTRRARAARPARAEGAGVRARGRGLTGARPGRVRCCERSGAAGQPPPLPFPEQPKPPELTELLLNEPSLAYPLLLSPP